MTSISKTNDGALSEERWSKQGSWHGPGVFDKTVSSWFGKVFNEHKDESHIPLKRKKSLWVGQCARGTRRNRRR